MRLKLFILCSLFTAALYAQVDIKQPLLKHKSGFAVVVDKQTYGRTADAVELYRAAVEKDGLSAYILISDWKNPDEVKAELVKLYKAEIPIEGAVFIGDIPIPMVRNAQHMTSAFKLPEDRYPFHRSSVPSDRFYDDFDLKFKYLGGDSVRPLYHYYSMLPESPQKIERDIYSGRVKPPVNDDSKYEMIRKYLKKAAVAKANLQPVNDMFVFTGHGYYSSSTVSWADERLSLMEQFPQLYKAGNRIKHFHHEMDDEMKDILLNELQRPELDIAFFHAHGSVELQYILDYPDGGNIQGYIENIKLYFRSKIRSARDKGKDVKEAEEYFKKTYNVTDAWLEGTFADSVIAADSVLGYTLDIYSDDIAAIKPQAKFVMFDECFNGSFHQQNYIAGKYIFNDGGTIAGEANSVNVLQDKWPGEFVGLINRGLSIGQWHRFTNLLESHIIGDPTFRFASNTRDNIWQAVLSETNNEQLWRSYLAGNDPELRSLALYMLYKIKGASFEKELVDIYMSDNSLNVRLHALKYMAEIDGSEFQEILKVSINDSYELIRRFSAIWMGEVGREDYLPYLLDNLLTDESKRVPFNGKSSLSFIDNDKARDLIQAKLSEIKNPNKRKALEINLLNSVKRNHAWIYDEMLPNIKSDTLKLKDKLAEAKTFRNYHFHQAVPELIMLAKDGSLEPALRAQLFESLGWFNMHYANKPLIAAACDEVLNDASAPEEVKTEALRTKNRLTSGLNHVFIP